MVFPSQAVHPPTPSTDFVNTDTRPFLGLQSHCSLQLCPARNLRSPARRVGRGVTPSGRARARGGPNSSSTGVFTWGEARKPLVPARALGEASLPRLVCWRADLRCPPNGVFDQRPAVPPLLSGRHSPGPGLARIWVDLGVLGGFSPIGSTPSVSLARGCPGAGALWGPDRRGGTFWPITRLVLVSGRPSRPASRARARGSFVTPPVCWRADLRCPPNGVFDPAHPLAPLLGGPTL